MNRPLSHTLQAVSVDQGAYFTADEFIHMIESGAVDGMNLELIGGRLERMNPAMSEHGRFHGDVHYALRTIFGAKRVFLDTGIVIDEATVMAADVTVVGAAFEEDRLLDSGEVSLVVEVSVSTLSRDKGVKRLAYAGAGIPHYWVIDTERRVTHVHADPIAGDYAEVSTTRFGAPLAVPGTDRTITLS